MADLSPNGSLRLLLITASPDAARKAEQAGVDWVFVDLEVHGKRERQLGRNTVLSDHTMDDVAAVRRVLTTSKLLVRLNPLHDGSPVEVNRAIQLGADLLMLPMFRSAAELDAFSRMASGRAGVVALVETPEAVADLIAITRVPGLSAVHVGLNDLSMALGQPFLFEPLASGMLDRIASVLRGAGIPFGFGGVARCGQDGVPLPAEVILAEHVRLGSTAVILSRSFHGGGAGAEKSLVDALDLKGEIARLRGVEAQLRRRSPQEMERDKVRAQQIIQALGGTLKKGGA